MVSLKTRLGALIIPTIALATPTPTVLENLPILPSVVNQVECLLVDAIIEDLRLIPTATQFCSSFLHIPTITTTATTTATSIIPTTSTKYTSTTTSTIGLVSTVTQTITSTSYSSTSTSTIYSTVTDHFCNGVPTANAVAKRDVLPSPVASFASAQISTACSCLYIPTPTTTVTTTTTVRSTSLQVVSTQATTFTSQVTSTSTTTVTSVVVAVATTTVTSIATATATPTSCPAPPSCGNQGLQFAVYNNSYGPISDSTYSNFHPEGFKTVTPEYVGTTSTIGGFNYKGSNPSTVTIYDQYTRLIEFWALNHRGYLYAGQTGAYTFSVDGTIDDIAEVWIGAKAYSGWARANEDLEAVLRGGGRTFRTNLVAGQYYAVRIVYGQAQGTFAAFPFSLTAPDGTVLSNGAAAAAPFLVQFSCDGSLAPAYAPFGQET